MLRTVVRLLPSQAHDVRALKVHVPKEKNVCRQPPCPIHAGRTSSLHCPVESGGTWGYSFVR